MFACVDAITDSDVIVTPVSVVVATAAGNVVIVTSLVAAVTAVIDSIAAGIIITITLHIRQCKKYSLD